MSAHTAGSSDRESWFLATVRGMGRRLSSVVGIISAATIMALQLVELGTEKGWHFRVYGWPHPDILINWQRNFAEIHQSDWPSVWVIVATGAFAGIAAAFTTSAVRQTVTNISHHFSTTWHVITSPPTDVVRADKDTREWVNNLSAKESTEQQKKIAELQDECDTLARERNALALKVSLQEETLRKAGERLKANERVFSQFEKLSRAMQSSIDRARQKYPV